MRRTDPPPPALTAAATRAVHDAAVARGGLVMWFVVAGGPAQPRRFTARGLVATHAGGEVLGVLAADTLDQLRLMLPPGLTWRERALVLSPEILETWD